MVTKDRRANLGFMDPRSRHGPTPIKAKQIGRGIGVSCQAPTLGSRFRSLRA